MAETEKRDVFDEEWETIRGGAVVVAHLRDPREKLWGLLLRMDPVGVQLRGIDLNSFDDFLRWEAAGHPPDEAGPAISTFFVPIGRVEKIYLDEASGPIPSCAERFFHAVGRSFLDYLKDPDGGAR